MLTGLFLLAALSGCNMPRGTETPLPSLVMIPSPTYYLATGTWVGPTPTVAPPTIPATALPGSAVPTSALPTPTVIWPTLTPGVPPTIPGPSPTFESTPAPTTTVVPNIPSGSYGVILTAPGDVLSIRTGAGAGYPVAGSFPSNATNVIRTGPSSMAGGDLWVQVQNPGGGTGWVNSQFLTEYKSSSDFCSDSRVTSLLANFGTAVSTSNGALLSALVSPAHGMTVYLWRNGIPHTFKSSDARWVFDSTYAHNWGSAPASGLDTIGPFHVEVVP